MEGLRVLFIGLAQDQLSAAVLEACLESAFSVKILCSTPAGCPPSSHIAVNSFGLHPATAWAGDESELANYISEGSYQLLIAAGCHHLLSPQVIESLPLGCFNVHPSLLPAYRGYSPIFWQYQRGEFRTGVTLHRMTPDVDSGEIVGQVEFQIKAGSPLAGVAPSYGQAAARLVKDFLADLREGRVISHPQPALQDGFVARKPKPGDYSLQLDCWPLQRIWHFLRMDPSCAGRILAETTGNRTSDGDRWDVGKIEPHAGTIPHCGLVATSTGYMLLHPEGKVRIERRRPEP